MLHRLLQIADNTLLIHKVCATHALQITQKAENCKIPQSASDILTNIQPSK